MSNHTIKAKNKKTGEMVEFKIINNPLIGGEYGYLHRGRLTSQSMFNDLFEVVEDDLQKNTNERYGNQVSDLLPQTDKGI